MLIVTKFNGLVVFMMHQLAILASFLPHKKLAHVFKTNRMKTAVIFFV